MAGFLGFLIAQVAKVFTHYYTERKWDLTRLVGSGGMPSSHTSFVSAGAGRGGGRGGARWLLNVGAAAASPGRQSRSTRGHAFQSAAAHKAARILGPPQVMGLTSALGVLEGTDSKYFAISLVFSLIVMYDATGVRLHAGKQASILNMIITELPPDHPVSSNGGPLKDTLGHTPLQVGRAGRGAGRSGRGSRMAGAGSCAAGKGVLFGQLGAGVQGPSLGRAVLCPRVLYTTA